MLRVAIIGCGKIADQHVQAIHRIGECEIVAACDREELMARQLAERFNIAGVFSESEKMLEAIVPDVVHITTPPQSHFLLAKQCLESGSHVYLEKPFTVTAAEAAELIALADSKGRKVTAGHNYQFTLEMMEMRRLIAAGFLGGKPIHLESHWSYDLSDMSYVGPILGSKSHWVRQLPGQLFHNLISHGIARLAEFLDDEFEIIADSHQSEQLRSLSGEEVQDELRVLLRDKNGTTAFFCFSTQIKPGSNRLLLCGPKNSLDVDLSSGSLIRLENKAAKSYLTYFTPPLRLARQHFRNARSNVLNFVRGRLHQDFGMKELIERFYESIRSGAAVPIPYREILLTARIMDDIFLQTYPGRVSTSQHLPVGDLIASS
ncbi:MAG: Gfo/Idh/MocA family oxidoreductase [Ktedonobacteraceae bacterium]|nr:Gfo/Idh/MocA family oxidoreductase [Ktedonobacteraceae bacterium]